MYRREAMIFEAALQYRDPAERHAYVVNACGSDGKLLAGVETLLRAHDSQSLLDEPVLQYDFQCDVPTPLESPGTVIGRYKLLEKIGEGGMAVVYMAEQEQPIRRKVALKIIKLGMDTKNVVARFEAERQALALMDHPNVAKIFDGGTTETGRPYFVMELVRGVSLTEYCDTNRLGPRERLELFVQVCQAVQHAHTKGIIHRDLKPSNVMVTLHDSRPVPKIIDFGIAKAINQRLTEQTLFTRYAQIIGTPEYMSPEQAQLSGLDVDTRTDIYSLGVLLYELLTGTTPFGEQELRRAGYLEMQRVIREQEPVKPSTKLSTLGETLTGIAKCRNCTPELLRKAIRGDLDWIVMKSLEKDRTRRYETASGLAEDIRRHLEHEPILARGPGAAYRLERFLRKHRSGVLTALALGVLAGAAAVVLSLWNQDRLRWNQDRVRLAEAERLQDQATLDQARDRQAKGDREAALETIQSLLDSPHVGPEAQLLRAAILVDNRCPEEATAILRSLLGERREVAGAAHSLLVRILRESGTLDAQRLRKIEEHRRQAEGLLPDTAEAHFLQAMAALTIKEQLAALAKALELDSKHYESRRLRAFTYYASRKYERMNEDALFMQAVRGRDPLGFSLRATALRELGRYREALADYDKAMSLTVQEDTSYVDLATQRCETLLRMGDDEHAAVDAEAYRKLWPEKPIFQYYLFCARTALGEYDKAVAVFQEIVERAPTARSEFWVWATKYVFDTLAAGRSWHPPDREPAGAVVSRASLPRFEGETPSIQRGQARPEPAERDGRDTARQSWHPTGAAFLPLIEADETYRALSAKAHRVVTNGFSAQWSPDGEKLAFSLGVHGYSGVAVYDPATKETELLIVPGKDPRWSPDGKYIAFVRDCQALRLEELTTTERKEQTRWVWDEEVWVMNADGTEPRRLARGGWPWWSKDATHIYYHSHLGEALCAISLAGPEVEPKRIMACASVFPSVSPDNQRVAYLEDGSLKVKDLASQAVVAEWRVPFGTWGGPAWSPTGRELCLGAGSSLGDRTGLWIYPLDSNEPAKVLTSQIMTASWAPDGAKLVFALRPPYFELWVADLDPAVSTIDALGPGQTLEEHWGQMLHLYTQRMRADPHDASPYADRARYYDYRHDRAEINADMRRWSAVVSGRSPSDSWFGMADGFRRAVSLPFDCELVFSAERPVNTIPTMSIAFGQKGRCEMKLFEIPMVVTPLLGFCLLTGLDTPVVQADFTFGKPTNMGPAINTPGWEGGQTISPDGLEFYFTSGDEGIWVARRATVNSAWEPATELGPPINTPYVEGAPAISHDGLSLYFSSTRPGGLGGHDFWVAKRAVIGDEWSAPVNLGSPVNTPEKEWIMSISADELELYSADSRPGGYGGYDLWVFKRATITDPWGPATNLGPTVNTSGWEFFSYVSPDGLSLFFESDRPGGFGGIDLWVSKRRTTTDPWGPPTNLGAMINGPSNDGIPSFSSDGATFYFGSWRSGGYGMCDIYQAPVIPTVDFNGDGKVDAKDMDLLVTNFGKNEPLYDIGPYPWGDGKVDEQDLKVVMGPLATPGPQALDVLSDVVLTWISPAFANTCDVYLGTSFEAVSTASRANPQGVLVSQGQIATTYDPAGLLEFSQTYYWRVDFVVSGATPLIYPGPVLKFTTAASVYPIKKITATASSSQRGGGGPEKTVDGSGLDASDGHSTEQKDMWWSTGAGPNWIQYEFDRAYPLHELWVWNFNLGIEPVMGFGAKTVKIEYSTDGTAWTTLANVPEFKKASGKAGYTADTKVSFGGVPAKFVKLTIDKNWGVAPQTGLSEVRFFCIQNAATAKP